MYPARLAGFEVVYKRNGTSYRITVENPRGAGRGVTQLEVDGADRTGQDIAILDDGQEHVVKVVLG
jgi:cellobiose phosphorylase